MVKERETAILYTCATCNLNCRYCYIDKNPALVEIDNILDESFKGDYYFEFIKKMFPNKMQLKSIETWGGEPFLHMDRIYETLHKVIQHYPMFSQMHSSTNFSFPEWNSQLFGLLNQFGQYPNRQFKYLLQLSIDGTKDINDAGRGVGTTKKCLENFKLFTEMVGNNVPPNVQLDITLKATLDKDSIKMLCNKEKIIEYYQFFENEFIDKINNLGYSNVMIYPPVPNTASPAPYTKEDGLIFAELCRLCGEIERENRTNRYFKYYNVITPYKFSLYNNQSRERTYKYKDYTCGTGSTVVGLLPNHYISACHNGFVDLVEDYKKLCTGNKGKSTIDFSMFLNNQPSRMTLSLDNYKVYEEQMGCYACEGTSARLAYITSLINVCAMAGQIDEQYKDPNKAFDAAMFIQNNTAYCVRNNYNSAGSVTLFPMGELYLLLNGAMQEILNGGFDSECK